MDKLLIIISLIVIRAVYRSAAEQNGKRTKKLHVDLTNRKNNTKIVSVCRDTRVNTVKRV
jgi:hypothetical protein